jgi:hypothetical protein
MVKKLRGPWFLLPAALVLMLGVWWLVARGRATSPGRVPAIPVVTIAPGPPATAPTIVIEPLRTESSLLLPLEAKLSDLQPLVEAAVPRKFDQALDLGAYGPAKDVRAVLDLARGDVTLTPRGDRLAFSFPLTGRIPIKARIDPGFGDGFAARESIDNVRGIVSGWVKLGIDGQWNLTHESDAAMRVDKAEVKFPLGITIGVRERLEEQTKAALAKLLETTLESAGVKMKIRERAGEAWSKLHAKHRVNETPEVAVSFQPLAVRMRPLRFDEDGVARVAVSVTGRTTTHLAAAAPDPERTTLPELVADENPGNHFHVVLPVSLRAADLAASNRQPLTAPGGVSFVSKQVRAFLVNHNAYLKIDFEASRQSPPAAASGTLYVAGTLAYDPPDRVLRMSDPGYDAQTRAALAGTAGWLLDPALVQSVAGSVEFPIDAALKSAPGAAGEQLARIKPPAGIDLGLTVTEAALRDVRPAGEWVHLLFDVKGTSHAKVTMPPRR